VTIAAFDLGASTLKSRLYDEQLAALGGTRRRRTPRPLHPDDLVSYIVRRTRSLGADRVGVGFPGDLTDDGRVFDPGNLARVDGPGTPQVPEVLAAWRDYPLRQRLRDGLLMPVEVANDAVCASLGCASGVGRELVVSLGTGLGVVVLHDGVWQHIGDVGGDATSGFSLDELVGEAARARDEVTWLRDVRGTLRALVARFEPTTLRLVGGNSKRLTPDVVTGVTLVIERGECGLVGAAMLGQRASRG